VIPGWPIEEGAQEAGWVSLAALSGDRFDVAEAYFDAAAIYEPGIDRRGQGAYFIGSVSYYYAFALAWSVLHGRGVPAFTADHLVMQLREGIDLRYRVLAAPAGDGAVGALVETALSPLVARIREATRLSEPAQWRLVADGVAGAFIAIGQHLGKLEEARAAGLALVRDPEWRFFNGHTDYYDVEGKCFLKRGGCCRYYTADAGSYCATCLLRPPEQHIDEIRRRYIDTAA
jgi:hypothetical protein